MKLGNKTSRKATLNMSAKKENSHIDFNEDAPINQYNLHTEEIEDSQSKTNNVSVKGEINDNEKDLIAKI